jgi:tetratricopeptide (TPR) repeat protein
MTYGELPSAALVARGRFEEAVAAAADELRAAPNDPEVYFNRAQAHAGLGRLAEAVADYETALGMDAAGSALDSETLDDELFDALRGLALERRGDPAAARRTLERYRELLPEGRHLPDLARWLEHLEGKEAIWRRERVMED